MHGLPDGGCGKSLLAMFFAGELTKRGIRCLYADWELNEHVQPRRTGEPQELRHEVVKALDLPSDLPQDLERVRVAAGEQLQEFLFEDAEVDLHRVEGVADLVGNTGREGLD